MNTLLLSALMAFNTCMPTDVQIEQWAVEAQIEIKEATLGNIKLGAADACYEYIREEVESLPLRDQAEFIVQTSIDQRISVARAISMARASTAVKEKVAYLLDERAAATPEPAPAPAQEQAK